MRYCFLTTGSWANNTMYMRFRELGIELIKRGVEVSYVIEDLPGNEPEHLKVDPKAKVHRTPPVKSFKSILYRRKLLKQEIRPDYVQVLNSPMKSLGVLMFSGMKVVADWDEWREAGKLRWWSPRALLSRFSDWWHRRYSALPVVCSRYLQREFEKLGMKPAYIPYATYLPPQPQNTTSPFTEPTAVYMGTLFAAFDQDVLFDALVILRDRGIHPPVRFVGGGPELEKWTRFVEEQKLTNVRMMGFLANEEMFQYLRHAQALLFPIRENMTNLCRCPSKTYVFAQAHRPVITNHVGEVPEILGEMATYIECSPAAFADAVADAMAPGAQLADVDYGIEKHNWSARTDALLAALEQLK